MFYCDNCRVTNAWPESIEGAITKCKVCGQHGPCNSMPSYLLPTVPEQMKEAMAAAEESETSDAVKDQYKDRYPMCDDQPAQIDCRRECRFNSGKGYCENVAPAITLNPDGTAVCWTQGMEETT